MRLVAAGIVAPVTMAWLANGAARAMPRLNRALAKRVRTCVSPETMPVRSKRWRVVPRTNQSRQPKKRTAGDPTRPTRVFGVNAPPEGVDAICSGQGSANGTFFVQFV